MLSFVRKGRLLFRRPYISVPFRTPDNDLIRYKPAVVEVIDEDDEEIIDELLPSGERDPRRIVAKKLLSLGKVMYKHIEPLPEWFLSKRSTLCAYRTPSQVRRCLKDWMIYVDRETNSKFRDKVVGWKIGPLNPERANDLRAYGPEEAIAYAHYFMPPRFSIARKVFVEVRTVLPNFKPSRVIDFGCGPGTAGAAVHDVWEGAMAKYVGVDMSRAMLDSAKIMLEGLGSVDAVFWDKTADVVKRARERGERYDLAIISYTLSELTSDHARRAATQIMYELLDVVGTFCLRLTFFFFRFIRSCAGWRAGHHRAGQSCGLLHLSIREETYSRELQRGRCQSASSEAVKASPGHALHHQEEVQAVVWRRRGSTEPAHRADSARACE